MAKSRKQKEEIVEKLAQELKDTKSFVISDYSGMSVAQVQELRKNLKGKDGQFAVVKNSLFKIALEKAEIDPAQFDGFTGPIALSTSSSDEVAPAKDTYDFAKDVEALEIKAGFLEGNVLSKEEVESLAQLPSKEELIAKTVGTIKAPINGFVNVLAGNARGLVIVLKAIADQKN